MSLIHWMTVHSQYPTKYRDVDDLLASHINTGGHDHGYVHIINI